MLYSTEIIGDGSAGPYKASIPDDMDRQSAKIICACEAIAPFIYLPIKAVTFDAGTDEFTFSFPVEQGEKVLISMFGSNSEDFECPLISCKTGDFTSDSALQAIAIDIPERLGHEGLGGH